MQLNVKDGTYKPYRKPNNDPVYINCLSNHPPNIIREIPKSINKSISEISSNENIFNNATTLYENALKASGFNEKLSYITPTTRNEDEEEKRQRKRKIIWFNPPYSANVKTNIGRIFFKLLNKHFPKQNPLHKIFNHNTVKISYSCMRNISSIISSHNKVLLSEKDVVYGCNCRKKNTCPLENKCLTPKVVYRAEITNDKDQENKTYIDLISFIRKLMDTHQFYFNVIE